jgi:hypothetical protein
MKTDKPLPITKEMAWQAEQASFKNGKVAGVDGQSLDDCSNELKCNLYNLWNPWAVRRTLAP